MEGTADSGTRPEVRLFAFALASLLWGFSAAAPGALHAQVADTATPVVTTQDGVYTAGQARRGEGLFRDACSDCHMEHWFQGSFLHAWNGATAGMLYERIRSTMPEDRTGGLANREYADILAYIFELNGLPTGDDELGSRRSELDRILIQGGQ